MGEWVVGVDGEGVVESVDEVGQGEFEGFEIANHVVVVESVGGDDDFDFPGVPMGVSASAGVFGEHVATLDFECFADFVGHGGW